MAPDGAFVEPNAIGSGARKGSGGIPSVQSITTTLNMLAKAMIMPARRVTIDTLLELTSQAEL